MSLKEKQELSFSKLFQIAEILGIDETNRGKQW
jgi:hypothetical protein